MTRNSTFNRREFISQSSKPTQPKGSGQSLHYLYPREPQTIVVRSASASSSGERGRRNGDPFGSILSTMRVCLGA